MTAVSTPLPLSPLIIYIFQAEQDTLTLVFFIYFILSYSASKMYKLIFTKFFSHSVSDMHKNKLPRI